jgi:nitrogen fixation protein FixH
MKPATRWLCLIGALMLGFALLSAWSFRRAARESSPVTDASYYSHGLRYNQTLLERQAAATLGWRAVPQLEGNHVTVRLFDRDRQAVSGAGATLTLLGTGAAHNLRLPLHEVTAGLYRAELPGGVYGDLAAEVAFERDGASLHQRLLLAIR